MKQQTFLTLPLLGRIKELALLEEKHNQACAYNGNCVCITGEPGVGKSRLMDEFLSHNKKRSLTVRVVLKHGTAHAQDVCVEIMRTHLTKISHTTRVITRIIDTEMYNEFAQSMPERPGRGGVERAGDDRVAGCGPRRRRFGVTLWRQPRALRAAKRRGHGLRHVGRDPAAHFRAVLHDQGSRKRLGARIGHRPRDRPAA